jgi:hypothetical protein
MHITTYPLLFLASAAAIASAWKMEVSYDDNTKMTFDGHTNSHCTKFKKHGAGIDNVYFKESTFADTFELFSDNHCKELVFKGKKGSNPVPDELYGSYKVY